MIKRKIPHTRKPTYPAGINRANPIGKKIDLYSPLSDLAGKDYAGNISPIASGVELKAGLRGISHNQSADDYLKYGDNHELTKNLFVGIWFKTTQTADGFLVAKSLYGGSAGRYYLGIYQGYIDFLIQTNTGTAQTRVTNTYSDGDWHFACGVRESGKEARLYIDGVKMATTAHTDALDYSTNYILLVGRYNDVPGTGIHATFGKYAGELSDFVLGHHSLSDFEANSLYRDFYQILKPRTQYIPITAVSGFQPHWALVSKRSGMIGAR